MATGSSVRTSRSLSRNKTHGGSVGSGHPICISCIAVCLLYSGTRMSAITPLIWLNFPPRRIFRSSANFQPRRSRQTSALVARQHLKSPNHPPPCCHCRPTLAARCSWTKWITNEPIVLLPQKVGWIIQRQNLNLSRPLVLDVHHSFCVEVGRHKAAQPAQTKCVVEQYDDQRHSQANVAPRA